MVFKKISIIGIGLMGASFAMAIKEKALAQRVCGYGRNENNLKRAKDKGIIDEYGLTIGEVGQGCNLLVFASPVGVFLELAREIAPYLSKGAIVSDMGSVKGELVYEMEETMPPGVSYVGAHPIAGNDKSGLDAAVPDLFKNVNCIVTPTNNTNETALAIVSDLWKTLGCNVRTLTPEKHDEIFSAISHMPHVAAYALVNAIKMIDEQYLNFSGTGFLDTTRIAMSSPQMWIDICMLNKDTIIRHLAKYMEVINTITDAIKTNDKDALRKQFDQARTLRLNLDRSKNAILNKE
ncbi:MAG: prephenate dehydrogenase/arogenate dehydrogenase family protein [Nitrospirae bacterium]|uniref:prephenate dehydrogenase n=1 Tax=Candidatus Magnetobacterium casense TaxID=1455061 RepID=UPI000591819B|nr:prephenate dehydrogenase/arogenate dehydrogenase family protein [Candidatus Magnetobacterium casensis]MBF0338788.1 prephenate dehydrogenase/arogenate dehydrogenase family protein [Nitrospirota bacterium]